MRTASTATLIRKYANPVAFREDLYIQAGRRVVRFGDVMAPFQRADFAALDEALTPLAAGGTPSLRKFMFERTKGASKDQDVGCALLHTITWAKRPLRIQVAAFSSEQADEIRLIIKSILRIDAPLNRLLREVNEVQSTRIVNTRTESEISIMTRSAGGLASHGARPDLVFCDELSHVADEDFIATICDNADKCPHAVTIICTNAGQLDSWQFRWREIARQSPNWYFSVYDRPAPWIDPRDLEESRLRNSPSRYSRLWLGRWVSGGDALDPELILSSIVLDGPTRKTPPGVVAFGGLDVGVKSDHSAYVTLGWEAKKERFFLMNCVSWTPPRGGEVDLMAVERAILESHSRYRYRTIGFDPSQALLLAQRLSRRNVPMTEVVFSGKNLNAMAEGAIESWNHRVIDLYEDPQLIRDLGRLNIVERSYGYRLESVADSYGHADRAVALMIALMLGRQLSRNTPIGLSGKFDGLTVVNDPRRHGVQLLPRDLERARQVRKKMFGYLIR